MEKNLLYDKSQDLFYSVYKKVAELSKKEKDNYLLQAITQDAASVAVQLYSMREYGSTKTFVIKLYVARRGVIRCQCWVELLEGVGLINSDYRAEVDGLLVELAKMLSASIATVTKKREESQKEA